MNSHVWPVKVGMIKVITQDYYQKMEENVEKNWWNGNVSCQTGCFSFTLTDQCLLSSLCYSLYVSREKASVYYRYWMHMFFFFIEGYTKTQIISLLVHIWQMKKYIVYVDISDLKACKLEKCCLLHNSNTENTK